MRRAALLLALLALAAPSASVAGVPRRSALAAPADEHAGHAHAAAGTPAVDSPPLDLAAVGAAAGGGAVGEMAIEKAEEAVVEAAVRKQVLYDEATAREERNRAATGALFVGGTRLQGARAALEGAKSAAAPVRFGEGAAAVCARRAALRMRCVP